MTSNRKLNNNCELMQTELRVHDSEFFKKHDTLDVIHSSEFGF